jgi:hypothetical protein
MRITLQNNNPVNACNNTLAVAASTPIQSRAFGFLINDDNVRKNPAKISNNTIAHQIATFLSEKLVTDHFFTSTGFCTCT